MQWVKTINKKTILFVLLFCLLFLIFRVDKLGSDTINPDAVNWHYRSEQFVVGLKNHIWSKTYQHYHPGVTLMWITGVPVEIFKQLSGVEVYNQYSFYSFHFIAKYALVIVQLILSVLLIFWLSKILKFNKALLTVTIFSFEPFIVGNSRLYHMDIIFTLFVFGGLVLSNLYIKEERNIWAILTGVFCSLAFLTRSLGIGSLLFVLGVGSIFLFYKTRDYKKVVKFMGLVLVPFIITTLTMFPALWEKPWWVLKDIFTEGERIGVRNGHSQIIFGKEVESAGFGFYPLVLVLKLSPFIIYGILLYLMKLVPIFRNKEVKSEVVLFKKEKYVGLISYSLIFYLGYFLVMSFPTKKIDRYMITIFPFIALISAFGFMSLISKTKQVWSSGFKVSAAFLLLLLLYSDISYHPYQFTYTNPIFGNAKKANDIIGQKSFGIGIFEVKDYLQSHYGSAAEVGFIDTKPIKSIYPNSQVSDIRINGVSDYDVMVLAVNEELPDKVKESSVSFVKDGSIYINGLEYWRFYFKKD